MARDEFYDVRLIKFLNEKFGNFKGIKPRIILVNPWQFEIEEFDIEIALQRGYYAYPPTGLLFLAAVLRQRNYDVQIVDFNYELLKRVHLEKTFNNQWVYELLAKFSKLSDPTVVGVSCMFSRFRNNFVTILENLQRQKNLVVLAGGTHVSFDYDSLLNLGQCHFAFTKDCEDKILYFLAVLQDVRFGDEACSGIYYWQDGLQETVGTDKLPKVNINIVDAYKLINVGDYVNVGSLNQYGRYFDANAAFSAVSLNRGCRGSCTFCSVRPLLGTGIRSRDIETVISELKYLQEQGIRQFDWLDDDLLANKQECLRLFRRMTDLNFELSWHANNGLIALSLDEEMLDAMQESGCIGFKIGVETGNQEIMKKIRKPANLERLLILGETLQKYPKMFIAACYIIGFPKEKFFQMIDTFSFALRMRLDWSSFFICQPLKGTETGAEFAEQKGQVDAPRNFLPARELVSQKANELKKGLEIFTIDGHQLIEAEQLNEVWFCFGFLANFINNKNLQEEGSPLKFINWIKAAIMSYPQDAGMWLFLAIAYAKIGNEIETRANLWQAQSIWQESEYWQQRFSQFYLTEIVENKMIALEVIVDKFSVANKKCQQTLVNMGIKFF